MKKLVILSAICFVSLGSLTAASTIDNSVKTEKKTKTGFHIDRTFTSRNGCKFHVVGDASWSGGFTGTITISGRKGCPEGTYHFDFAPNPNDNDCTLTMEDGDKVAFAAIQDDPTMECEMVKYFRSIGR